MTTCVGTALPNAALLPGFCAFALPVTLLTPRTILAVPGSNQLLALERGTESIVLLRDSNGDSVPDTYRRLASLVGINHGLALDADNELLYASTPHAVYRWSYTGGTNFSSLSRPTTVVSNLSADGKGGTSSGNHVTRSLILDATGGFLFVSVGSVGNVDVDSYRSRIRRVDVRDSSNFPVDFTVAPVYADGVRNEVGLAWDRLGILWGVDNGPDNLFRSDLGSGIHQDNPGEELNRFNVRNRHFGYPYCWTEYNLSTGLGRGTAWAWPASQLGSVTYTDALCRNTTLFQPPEVTMQGHSAPLGLVFYRYKPQSERPPGCAGAFPSWMDGYAFIAFHGSWNRDVPTGYKVVYVEMRNGRAVGQPVDFLKHSGADARWPEGLRPVSLDFDACGRLYVSSDGSGPGSKILRIEYGTPSPPTAPAPTPTRPAPTLTGKICRTLKQRCGVLNRCCRNLRCIVKAQARCAKCRSRGQACKSGWCCSGLICARRRQNGFGNCRRQD